MAEPRHHRRVHEELAAVWGRVFAACTDLPHPPHLVVQQALHLSAWGGRRYVLLLQLDPPETRQWADGVEQLRSAAIRQQMAQAR